MRPLIREKDKKYIEVIGHYDNPVLCAKMTLLADLYAVEHKEGYALFKVEDYDKLAKIDGKLEFTFSGDEEPSNSISDLTGTTWLINNVVDVYNQNNTYDLSFTSNNTSFIKFGTVYDIGSDSGSGDGPDNQGLDYYYDEWNSDRVYNARNNTWSNNSYKTITITGGTDATNSNLIAFLEANATQVIEESNNIFFGNSSISKITLGNSEVTKLFLGSVEIYSKETSNGYQVTVQCNGGSGTLYDGQDSSGILLGTITYDETKTYAITSGYIYCSTPGYHFNGGINPLQITSDIAISLNSGGSND